jgi:hypothetical protein
MTPVRVMEDDGGVAVVFLESARFYKIAADDPEFDSLLATLREAVEKNESVDVHTESIDSDIIKNVRR